MGKAEEAFRILVSKDFAKWLFGRHREMGEHIIMDHM
jgi:hypothetical protein